MSNKHPILLIVDDDTALLQVLARAMRKRGYEVITACCIESTCKLLTLFTPQFAIIDLKLANESGLEVIPLVKRHAPTAKLLVLTGYASIATAVAAVKLGANNYLCKPATAAEIEAALTQQEGTPTPELSEKPMPIEQLEWEHIQKVLLANQGNISATARALGMHRRTLQRKLQVGERKKSAI
ncbi:response regulator transcription factor [Spartinivicinus poritis]|uniref:Response regulator transcription factor n=1 Tax=Spartinivicinus poritis TaxID=2994640 RepID=A0ABT5U9W0_9GAMM|nr:response regulator transcription factor [Spartinivicinus sp. A2-2]MDE1463082.1 response regulator transcription factor [Spartinivicinus sp. A2-2]